MARQKGIGQLARLARPSCLGERLDPQHLGLGSQRATGKLSLVGRQRPERRSWLPSLHGRTSLVQTLDLRPQSGTASAAPADRRSLAGRLGRRILAVLLYVYLGHVGRLGERARLDRLRRGLSLLGHRGDHGDRGLRRRLRLAHLLRHAEGGHAAHRGDANPFDQACFYARSCSSRRHCCRFSTAGFCRR